MISFVKGNIFDSEAEMLVNPVNTVGVMGKGLALEFKKRYPRMFEDYKIACNQGLFYIGQLMICTEKDHRILLFPTKKHWKYPSKIEYIESGLRAFVGVSKTMNISTIAFPPLGCGCGGLKWDDVKPLMEQYLAPLPQITYIYCK